MKITSRVDYAVSCVLRIADKYGKNNPVTVREVAKKEGLEPDYVEQLFMAMKRSGILKSIRGKAGGYVLAASPGKITVKDVIEAIDRKVLELVCSREKGRRRSCIYLSNCRIMNFWEELGRSMESFLKGYTLDRLIKLRRKDKNW